MEEEKWFAIPTWDLESGTESVVILLVTKSTSLSQQVKTTQIRANSVVKYLESLGFKCLEKATCPVTIYVNLVEKTLTCLGLFKRNYDGVPIAVPSQIPTYLEANKGFLAGRKFGL